MWKSYKWLLLLGRLAAKGTRGVSSRNGPSAVHVSIVWSAVDHVVGQAVGDSEGDEGPLDGEGHRFVEGRRLQVEGRVRRQDGSSEPGEGREVLQVDGVQGRLPGHNDEGRLSLRQTSAARRSRLSARPPAIAAAVAMLHGTTVMPRVAKVPLAMGAFNSPIGW